MSDVPRVVVRRAVGVALVVATVSWSGDRALAAEPGFTATERAQIVSMWLGNLGAPPADPSNRVADDPRAAALGEKLFFDPRLSANGEISCASCHRPMRHFADDAARSTGIALTRRNAPSLLGSAHQSWFYWDGRRDSQWAQALTPLEHPDEHGLSRIAVLRVVANDMQYRDAYTAIFGALPALADAARFPAAAMPAGPVEVRRAWFAMTAADRESIDTGFANIGKTLAAFERTLDVAPSRFDAFAASLLPATNAGAVSTVVAGAASGKATGGIARSAARTTTEPPAAMSVRLTGDERKGLKVFLSDRAQCTRCHNGPLLSNGEFHNIGLEQRGTGNADAGRAAGVREVRADPFNCLGRHSDANEDQCVELAFMRMRSPELPGAFKVPTLRNVAETAPYMHDGRFATLEAVLAHYASPPVDVLGHQEVEPTGLTAEDIRVLVVFLRTLTGTNVTTNR